MDDLVAELMGKVNLYKLQTMLARAEASHLRSVMEYSGLAADYHRLQNEVWQLKMELIRVKLKLHQLETSDQET